MLAKNSGQSSNHLAPASIVLTRCNYVVEKNTETAASSWVAGYNIWLANQCSSKVYKNFVIIQIATRCHVFHKEKLTLTKSEPLLLNKTEPPLFFCLIKL